VKSLNQGAFHHLSAIFPPENAVERFFSPSTTKISDEARSII